MGEKLVIKNIGMILSGKFEDPIFDGDCMIAIDGKIADWGSEKDLDTEDATTVVDAKGVTLAPGLIDSHIHPVVGDYTPRQQQLHWIDSTLHGGVTTLISAGEVHMPGRPKDVVGLKAMAIASQRWYENFRPSGVKVHAGAPGGTWYCEGWQNRAADGGLGSQIWHSEHDPHWRPLYSGLRFD